MKTTGKTTMWLVALGLGVSLPLAALATPDDGPGDGPRDGHGEFRGKGHGDRRGRLKAMHARLLKEKVGLDDARVAKVQAVKEQFRAQTRALHEDMKTARESLKILVESNSTDDRAYTKAIAQVRAAHTKLQQARRDEIEAVANLLSAKEQATLMVMMEKVRSHHGMRGRGGRGGKRGEWGGRGGRGHGPRGGPDGFGPGDFGPDAE